MPSPRTDTILKYIISEYIASANPVSSQSIARQSGLEVSPATIRNEMAYLEEQGYILRPHTSAGSVPSDKGYRYYVDSLGKLDLSDERRRLLSHLFHQVEEEIEKWLSLAATILAQLSQNVAVVAVPKQADCRYKYLELVSLQEKMALEVLVLLGAKVKQKLISFDHPVLQSELVAIANRLNESCPGLTSGEISARQRTTPAIEQKIVDSLVEIMHAEDEQDYQNPYLDGLHLILSQPEFARGQQLKDFIELIETRTLLKIMVPAGLKSRAVHVIIGNENKAAAIRNCSVIISQYGLPQATGTIGVVGPTRMPYSNAIPLVNYLSSVLTEMMAGLYGEKSASAN